MRRLVILSGPSCAGKSPLHAALSKFYPELASTLTKLVLYNSRAPRPGEVDGKTYHFRRREEIAPWSGDNNYVVLEVRGDLQALDLTQLKQLLAAGNAFFEGNPFIGRKLQSVVHSRTAVLGAFLAPLSKDEIIYLKGSERNVSLPDFVAEVMRRKLLRRTQGQKRILSLKDLETIERRATSAYSELKEACYFDYVIPNHDGEDSDNWEGFYFPVGDARKALLAFVDLLEGRIPALAEKWNQDLLP